MGVAKEGTMSDERRCKSCDKVIPADRLRVMRNTRVCVECSAELGPEDVAVASYESLGKANSMKKTYGGVTIRWRRRH
jgi:RNA polymerase-binding transcription factor DksA